MQNFRIYYFLLLLVTLASCNHNSNLSYPARLHFASDSTAMESVSNISINRFGKTLNADKLSDIYTAHNIDTILFPQIGNDFLEALRRNEILLDVRSQRYNRRIGNLRVTLDELKQTTALLQDWQHIIPLDLNEELRAYQIWGNDRKGNVKFTGYYTPIVKVSKTKRGAYIHPILSSPKNFEGQLPTRAEIEGGALDTVCSIIAYAKSKIDIYFMQQQGSGYVEYKSGKREYLAYDGQNGHSFISIEQELARNSKTYKISDVSVEGIKRYFSVRPEMIDSVLNINPSFTFFRKVNSKPMGAGHVPLTPEYSIAVDPRYIPLGSILLAAFPVIDEAGDVKDHEYRFVVAQDVGGAIRGSGHIDCYFGVGATARKKAMNFSYYGKLWLILPEGKPMQQTVVGPTIS